MIEPNCDMPWEVYLDWLQDQGNEDLRFIEPGCLILGCTYMAIGNAGTIDGQFGVNGGDAHSIFPARCINLNKLAFGTGVPYYHDFDNGYVGYSGGGDDNYGKGLICFLDSDV